MGITAKQIGYGWSLLRNAGFDEEEDKEAFVLELTHERTTSLRQLTQAEFNKMVKALDNGHVNKKKKMVNTVLSLAHEMCWELENGRVDMDKINGFCQNKTRFKKPLDDLKYNQLQEVVSIFRKMHEAFLKAL